MTTANLTDRECCECGKPYRSADDDYCPKCSAMADQQTEIEEAEAEVEAIRDEIREANVRLTAALSRVNTAHRTMTRLAAK